MAQPAHFKQVFVSVLERYPEDSITSVDLADRLVEALDLADVIMGNVAARPAASRTGVLIQTPPTRQYPPIDLRQGRALLGAESQVNVTARIVGEAPPVAVVRNADAAPVFESEEEIERKKNDLFGELTSVLPAALTINLPALGRDITLQRYVKVSPAGMSFIRVLYAQHAEEEDGPQVQVTTGDKNINYDKIKAVIVEQAAMRYRPDRPKIVPKVEPPKGFPTEAEMEFAIARNPDLRTDDRTSAEDINDWNQARRART